MAKTGTTPEKPPVWRIRPVTKRNISDLEALFESKGAPSYCWCMAWRDKSKDATAIYGDTRKDGLLNRARGGIPVGMIAYDGDTPTAWVSLGPKESFKNLGGPEPVDGETIWSLVCYYIPRALRGQGLSQTLLKAAIAYARKRGADVLEAYPVDSDSPSYRFMGFVPLYKNAGFHAAGTAGSRRHVMRLKL
jgi:GNAT superfamily N-acetyltransferase